MGNTSEEKVIAIGEILLDSNNDRACFSYNVMEAISLNLIVQDKLGRTMISSNHLLDPKDISLDFSTRSLGAGDYHAWIYVADEVFVRRFVVEKPEDNGFLGKVLSFFK